MRCLIYNIKTKVEYVLLIKTIPLTRLIEFILLKIATYGNWLLDTIKGFVDLFLLGYIMEWY